MLVVRFMFHFVYILYDIEKTFSQYWIIISFIIVCGLCALYMCCQRHDFHMYTCYMWLWEAFTHHYQKQNNFTRTKIKKSLLWNVNFGLMSGFFYRAPHIVCRAFVVTYLSPENSYQTSISDGADEKTFPTIIIVLKFRSILMV